MEEIEKSPFGIVEILFRVGAAALCLGVMIAAAITLSTIDDVYPVDPPDNSEAAVDRNAYRGVAGWLVAIGSLCVAVEVIMAIIRALYFVQIIPVGFVTFEALNTVTTVFFALGLISGGVGSAVNAINVQSDYDKAICDQVSSYYNRYSVENTFCDDIEKLRDSQYACAALSFLGAGVCLALSVIAMISAVKKSKEELRA